MQFSSSTPAPASPSNVFPPQSGPTVSLAGLALFLAGFLIFSGIIGSEFLPHLDEGSIWVRGTLAPSTGPPRAFAS